ncbi:hypothetical protein Mapa_009232 [Marchantia paleacea]|nr:hypothetical protein Mapa_009232 [Marchantia paleacea]
MYVNSYVPKHMHHLQFSDNITYHDSKSSTRDCDYDLVSGYDQHMLDQRPQGSTPFIG